MKVFLVEDSLAVRERLRGMIACIPGIELVGEAAKEDDAMREIGASLPDVVILDLTLASGSGFGVLRRIRLQPLNMRVIVLSNFTDPRCREKCITSGADYFFDKTNEITKLEDSLLHLARSFMGGNDGFSF